jgi:hypothetical protein
MHAAFCLSFFLKLGQCIKSTHKLYTKVLAFGDFFHLFCICLFLASRCKFNKKLKTYLAGNALQSILLSFILQKFQQHVEGVRKKTVGPDTVRGVQ